MTSWATARQVGVKKLVADKRSPLRCESGRGFFICVRECVSGDCVASDDPMESKGPRKDLGNFAGPFHSALAAHFRAAGSNYSQTTYSPLKAFLPGHMLTWISHVAKFWFRRKHNFRDYTAQGKGDGIHEISDHATLGLLGDWGTGTDEA